MERMNYVFGPESEEQAIRIAGYLEYKKIPYKTGRTCGKGLGIFIVDLTLIERIQFYLAFGNVYRYDRIAYYQLADRSGI